MNNIIKMLSKNKDYRIAIVDTSELSAKLLRSFEGSRAMKTLLESIITHCTLLSAINDFDKKISFSFRLSQGVSVYCLIEASTFSLEYNESINHYNGKVSDLFDNKSILSVTTGNWQTGLHTGTVEANIDSIGMLLSHYSVQSEQLPTHLIPSGRNYSRAIIMQPLPYADELTISKIDDELRYMSKALEHVDWNKASTLFSHMANVIAEYNIE